MTKGRVTSMQYPLYLYEHAAPVWVESCEYRRGLLWSSELAGRYNCSPTVLRRGGSPPCTCLWVVGNAAVGIQLHKVYKGPKMWYAK
jgi:hypothetical protein